MAALVGSSVDVETAFALKEFFQSQGSFKIASEFGQGQQNTDF